MVGEDHQQRAQKNSGEGLMAAASFIDLFTAGLLIAGGIYLACWIVSKVFDSMFEDLEGGMWR